MDGLRQPPMDSAPLNSRLSGSSEARGALGSHGVPCHLLDPVRRRLSAQLRSGGSITAGQSPCPSATTPPGQVVNWEAAAVARGPPVAASNHSFPGGNPRNNLLLIPNGDPRMQQADRECLTESVGASSGTVSSEDAARIRNSNFRACHGAALPLGLSQNPPCGAFGVLPRLIPGMPDAEHLVWDGRGQQRLRRTSALDVQAPPGYESVDISFSSCFTKPSLAEHEAPTHDFPLAQRVGSPEVFQGPCEQQPLGEYFKRRWSTHSPLTQVARGKGCGCGRKTRSHRGFLASATSSVESAASAPVRNSPDAVGVDVKAQKEEIRNEGWRGIERIPSEAGLPQALNQLYKEAASFVGLLYNSLLDTSHSVELSSNRTSRRLPPEHLSDIVSVLYSPWCTRKQLLDPQLVGELAHDQPVFDEGTGHTDVLRQLTVLRSCISEFSLRAERMQAGVAAAGRLSCSLRGTVAAQRAPLQSGAREHGREGTSRGVVDFAPTAKMGRFAHFLTLHPKPPSTETTDPAVNNGGKTTSNAGHWFPLVCRSSFVVESETFVLLTASQEGTTHSTLQVINEHSFISDADLNTGAITGFPAASGVGRSASPLGLESLLQGLAQSHAKRDTLSCLSSMLKSAISLGQDCAVSAPGGSRDPSSGELPSGALSIQGAVGKLATSLLAGAGVTNQHVSGMTPWPAMQDTPQRQRRSRKKKKSRRNGNDRNQQEPDLLSSNDLGAVGTPLSSFQLDTHPQMQQFEQRHQDWREDLRNGTYLPTKGILASPGLQCMSQEAFDRTVFVSWIPRAARAQELSEKVAAEQKLKTVLAEDLGICGIERVLVFPPRGSHCCIVFHHSDASLAFMVEYAGGTFTPNTEKFKERICASFNVNIDRGIQRVFIRIEKVRMMPPAVRVADPEKTA